VSDDTRTCTLCDEALPLTRFEGGRRQCKLCRGRRREARLTPEQVAAKRAYRRQWQKDNPAWREYHAKWRADNRDRLNEQSRSYWRDRADKDKSRATRQAWTEANREHIAAVNAAWYQANLDKAKEARQRRRSHMAAVPAIPFTADQLAARLAFYGYRCWMCGGPYEHLDHVKPVSKGGPHMLANYRPACHGCNIRKRDWWDGPVEAHARRAAGL
jgi:hypothetical protein